MPRIISTMVSSVTYSSKIKTSAGFQITQKVHVKGGTGMVSRTGHTQIGTETHVTDDELKVCQSDPVFAAQCRAGYILVMYDHDKKVAEAAAADMKTADGSSPVSLSDYPGLEEGETKVAAVGGEPVENLKSRKK